MSDYIKLNYDYDINNIVQSLHTNFAQYNIPENMIKDLIFYTKCQRFNTWIWGTSSIYNNHMLINYGIIEEFAKYFKYDEFPAFIKCRGIIKITISLDANVLKSVLDNILITDNIKIIVFDCEYCKYPIDTILSFIKLIKIPELIFNYKFCMKNDHRDNLQILESIENNKNIKKVGFLDDSFYDEFIEKLFNIKSLKSICIHSLNDFQYKILADNLAKNETLEELIVDMHINEYEFEIFINALTKNKCLQYLRSSQDIVFDNDDFKLISKMLDTNKSLQVILSDNMNSPKEFIELIKSKKQCDEYKNLCSEIVQKLKNNKQLLADVKKSKKEGLINFAIYLPNKILDFNEFIEFYINLPINVYDYNIC